MYYIYIYICMNIIIWYKSLSNLGIPTIRQGDIEERNGTSKNLTLLGFEPRTSTYRTAALPTVLLCQFPTFNALKHSNLQFISLFSFSVWTFIDMLFAIIIS